MKRDAEMGQETAGYSATPGTVPVSHTGSQIALKRLSKISIALRLSAAALCVVAMATMVTNKQTHKFALTSNLSLEKTATYTTVLATVAYVYTNAGVAGYTLLQAVLSLVTKNVTTSRLQLWITFILDQVAVYVLLGVVGATTEVAFVAKTGEDKILWEKQCQNFSRFCNMVGISVIICFLSILTLAAIAAISAKRLFTDRTSQRPTNKEAY
ncbi:hypothetical protein R1sor_013068 [Riccia sorocarpa]|uniref:CASP-like protein n=1 Tax=Riccia sorocarpa TaxID=122646 RepID=A0ABD3H8A9_9MARC